MQRGAVLTTEYQQWFSPEYAHLDTRETGESAGHTSMVILTWMRQQVAVHTTQSINNDFDLNVLTWIHKGQVDWLATQHQW